MKMPEGYCDEPYMEWIQPSQPRLKGGHCKIKPRGHIPGGSPTVPRDAYAAIVLLSELFSWTRHDIGRLWGIKPISVRTIIRRWKSE